MTRFSDLTPPQQEAELALAEERIARMKAGDEIFVRFTAGGRRKARITRRGRGGGLFIVTFNATGRCWSKERRLTARDLLP